MIVVEPSVELEWITPNAEQVIERAGRTAYKSEDKITPDSAAKFITMIIASGHHSVLEHASASFRFIFDRGISHEAVRHRLCSIVQESSRYCSYNKDKFGSQIRVVVPPFTSSDKEAAREVWARAVEAAESAYMQLIALGEKPQIARSVLPTCLKTEMCMMANFREWRTIFYLRLDKKAHPQIQQVMAMAAKILIEKCPAVFGQYAARVEEILSGRQSS